MNDFFAFRSRWRISAHLVMKTPLSIGSRLSFLPAGSDLPVIKTPDGTPFIPGSSLKGVICAYTERLLRTLNDDRKKWKGQQLWACDPLREQQRCVIATCCDRCEECQAHCCSECSHCKSCMVNRRSHNGELDDAGFTKELWEHSCTACRLFGSPWLASRVAFQDALLSNSDEMLRLTEVRDGVGIDRDLGTAKRGIKYDYEVVPAGARFDLRIVVENADEWEVGLLLVALRALEQGELPLGGKTSRGLGWGTMQELTVRHLTVDDLVPFLLGQDAPQVNPQELIDTFVQGLQ